MPDRRPRHALRSAAAPGVLALVALLTTVGCNSTSTQNQLDGKQQEAPAQPSLEPVQPSVNPGASEVAERTGESAQPVDPSAPPSLSSTTQAK